MFIKKTKNINNIDDVFETIRVTPNIDRVFIYFKNSNIIYYSKYDDSDKNIQLQDIRKITTIQEIINGSNDCPRN